VPGSDYDSIVRPPGALPVVNWISNSTRWHGAPGHRAPVRGCAEVEDWPLFVNRELKLEAGPASRGIVDGTIRGTL